MRRNFAIRIGGGAVGDMYNIIVRLAKGGGCCCVGNKEKQQY